MLGGAYNKLDSIRTYTMIILITEYGFGRFKLKNSSEVVCWYH